MEETLLSELQKLEAYVESSGRLFWDLTENGVLAEKWTTITISHFHKFGTSWTLISPKDQRLGISALQEHIRKRLIDYDNGTALRLFVLLTQLDIQWDIQQSVWEAYFDELPLDRREGLAQRVIESLNRYDWLVGVVIQRSPKTMEDWERLVGEFRDAFDLLFSPFHAIPILLGSIGAESLQYVFGELDSLLFALLVSIGANGAVFWKHGRRLLEFMAADYRPNENVDLEIRVALFLKHMRDQDAKAPDIELLIELVSRFWPTVGRAVFARAYSLWWRTKPEFRIEPYERAVKLTLSRWIERNDTEFLAVFEWPKDFVAFAGYLLSVRDTDTSAVDVTPKVELALSETLYRQWSRFSFSPELLSSYRPPGDLEDILEPQNNLALNLASHAVFFHSEAIDEWFTVLKAFLFELRPLFYSSYEIALRAREYVAFLIVFCFVAVDQDDIPEIGLDRIKTALKLIAETVLYPFVSSYELSEDIWNVKRTMTGELWEYGSQRVYLANLLLARVAKKDSPKLVSTYKNCMDAWRKFACAKWPWMYADWPDGDA